MRLHVLPFVPSAFRGGCFAIALTASQAFAVTYYVDCGSGNDSSSGTSAGAPWATLAKASSVTLSPGDALLFKRGALCRGTLNLKTANVAGPAIHVGAYPESSNSENRAIFSGGIPLPGAWSFAWNTTTGLPIFVTSIAEPVSQLLYKDLANPAVQLQQPLARFPNSGYEAKTVGSQFTAANGMHKLTMSTAPYAYFPRSAGEQIVVRANDWFIAKGDITGSAGKALNVKLTNSYAFINSKPLLSRGIIRFNSLHYLDAPGEWYHDTAAGKLYFVPPDGWAFEGHQTRFSRPQSLLLHYGGGARSASLSVSNIAFVNAGADAVGFNGLKSVTARNLLIERSNGNGITFYQIDSVLLEASKINHSNAKGVGAFDIGSFTMRWNWVVESGKMTTLAGLGQGDMSGVMANGIGTLTVDGNWIYRSGYASFMTGGVADKMQISNNTFTDYCLLLNDCGGIYVHQGRKADGKSYFLPKGMGRIEGNTIANGWGNYDGMYIPIYRRYFASGVYLDNGTSHINVLSNDIKENRSTWGAVLVHGGSWNSVMNNTILHRKPFGVAVKLHPCSGRCAKDVPQTMTANVIKPNTITQP